MPLPDPTSSASVNQKSLVRFTLLALALLGFLGLLITTRWGVGASPDSVVYIVGARNLVGGQGFSMISGHGETEAITHHAPFYSTVLALIDLRGPDPLQGGRWLNALLFAGNILLVGLLLQESLPSDSVEGRLAPIIGAGLVLFPAMLVEVFSMAWSETLFLFLTLSGFWALSRAIRDQSGWFLVFSAILIALAFLTRYIGVALVASGVVSILLFSERPLRRRVADSVLFGLVSIAPMGLWMVRNLLAGGSATSREVFFHPITRQQIGLAVTTLGSWLLIPETSSALVKILPYLVIGLIIAAIVIIKQREDNSRSERKRWVTLSALPVLIRILMVFIALYLAFLLVSLSFLDANTPLDSRILSPIYVTGVVLTLYFLTEGLGGLNMPAVARYALISVSFILMAALAGRSLDYLQASYANGIGFTNRWWRESPTLVALQNYPSDSMVYSNAPEALYLYTRQIVQSMPKKYESANRRPNEHYEVELMALRDKIRSQGGIIVYFDSMRRSTLPSEQEILEVLDLEVLEQTADGVIYGIKGQYSAGISNNLW